MKLNELTKQIKKIIKQKGIDPDTKIDIVMIYKSTEEIDIIQTDNHGWMIVDTKLVNKV